MKKFSVIPVALLILLSGMHMTVATHFCGGKVAATRVSFSGESASCGMENRDKATSSSETRISSHCCYNEFAIYLIEDDYAPSGFQSGDFHSFSLWHSFVSSVTAEKTHLFTASNTTEVRPPGYFMSTAVNRTDICVFRIWLHPSVSLVFRNDSCSLTMNCHLLLSINI